MKRLTRIILIIFGVILVLVIAAAAGGYYTVRQAHPETAGTLTLPGLQDDVHIYRDEYGIPHIYANNQEDLFFAQGFVHAQDRFWQMEFWRHVGGGRISEIAGAPTIEQDKFLRTIGINRMAQTAAAYHEAEEPEYMELLQAYSDGVNAYIEQNRDDLPLQFQILGLVNEPWEIEPWTPLNTIAWGVFMAYNLGGNMDAEISRVKLVQAAGEEALKDLSLGYPYEHRPVIAPTSEQANSLNAAINSEQIAATTAKPSTVEWQAINLDAVAWIPDMNWAFGDGPFVGSNNWVVSGEHTETGEPLLANDPHLALQMPAIWYEVGLHAPGWDVTGFSFAGVPGIVIGHNDQIAWGVTNVGPDVQDLFIEKINPDDPNQYEFEGEWRDMEVIEEVIKVNGGDDVVLEVRATHHGPVISDIRDDVEDVLALQWTQQQPSRILQSVILLNQAGNFEEFREALRYWDVPSQNIVYADKEGNIGYQVPGLIPIRKNGDGQMPVPGWTGEYEWEGWVPFEELPALFNPEKGYIVTANHAVVDEEYPHFLARDWSSGDRGLRIVDMIEAEIANGKISADDFARIQFDSKSLPAESWIPHLAGLSSSDPQVQEALDLLQGWDFQERIDSVPATIFEIFYLHLAWNILVDDIGPDNMENFRKDLFMHELAREMDSPRWDNMDTSDVETPDVILLQSLEDTLAWLETNVGGEMSEWTWGNIHTVTFADAILGASGVAPIEAIFNRGPYPLDGGSDLVNAQSWDSEDPAKVDWHPSMRMIVDLSDLDASRSVIPTGNSGHPYSDHYDDQMPLWMNGETHPMLFSREAVEAAAVDHLILAPER